MKKVNEFAFCPRNYIDDNGEENVFLMYTDVIKFIQLAFQNGYQIKLWNDGYTTVVEYDFQDEDLSGRRLEWLEPDEYIFKEGEEID